MDVITLRLLCDFGLLVLIWMIQLVIYPSFQFYSASDLIKWHQKYTLIISFIVIPLMFGQLIMALVQLFEERTLYTMGSFILIALVWVSTFVQFVPIHATISSGNVTKELLRQLVSKNWLRTVVWTLICIISLIFISK